MNSMIEILLPERTRAREMIWYFLHRLSAGEEILQRGIGATDLMVGSLLLLRRAAVKLLDGHSITAGFP